MQMNILVSKIKKFGTLVISFLMIFSTLFSANANAAQNPEQKRNNTVHIAMALDDNYTYPTLVSITSALENKAPSSIYHYYIMHPDNFKKSNKLKLQELESMYSNCSIHFMNMGDLYKNARQGHVTTPAYYRLVLSEFLPKLDRIIYLDGDTLIFHDLNEMYNLNLGNNYYMGFLDHKPHIKSLEKFGVPYKHRVNYICSGVLLINLAQLRKDQMVQKFEDFIKKHNKQLSAHDQTIINAVCAGRIGILPAKCGLFNFNNAQEAMNYPKNRLLSPLKYSEQEMKAAHKDPTIMHMVRKPWRRSSKKYKGETWWEYAYKTKHFKEIATCYLKKHPQTIVNVPKRLQKIIKSFN